MKNVIIFLLFFILTISFSKNIYAQKFEILNGLTIGGGITMVLQNLQNSNVSEPKNTDGDLLEPNKTPTLGQYSIDLTVKKNFDDNNIAYIHLDIGKGDIGYYLDSYANVNGDANDKGVVTLKEAWFKHKFNKEFAMSVGILDSDKALDENAYANDEKTQFLGEMFKNSINIDFADHAFGLKAAYKTDFADFAVQYIDARNNSEDIIKYGFVSVQINFKPEFIDDMDGNYRVFGWTNIGDYEKFDGNGKGKDYGFGISFDQQFMDIFGGFARYSWKNGNIASGEHTWSLGLQAEVKGIIKKDVVAVAYGQIIPSNYYKDYFNKNAKSENHLEVYYNWKITDYLGVSPDFQMVENPYFNENDDTAYVSSIRIQVSF